MRHGGLRPHDLHLVDHRPARDQPRPRPLFGEQGRHQRLHPRRRARVRRLRHHRQRRRARQHPDRRHEAAPQRRLHQGDGGHDPARPPRHARGRRQRRPVPRLRRGRATSPARRSSSTAARCCPRAPTSASGPRSRRSFHGRSELHDYRCQAAVRRAKMRRDELPRGNCDAVAWSVDSLSRSRNDPT